MPAEYSIITDTKMLCTKQYGMYITDFEKITKLSISKVDCKYSLYFVMPPNLNKLTIRKCGLSNIQFNIPTSVRILDLSFNSLTYISHTILGHVTHLLCNNNLLSYLSGINANLRVLKCHNNYQLRSISLPNPITSNLQVLDCSNCRLSELPLLPHGLVRLDCSGNPNLTTLPRIPSKLEFLNCSTCIINLLPDFPVDSKLKVLKCMDNKLTSLPDLPPMLEHISCSYNSIYYLPNNLPKYLRVLRCQNNLLYILPEALPDTLTELDCAHNQLTRMPSHLSSLTKLETISCSYNKLTYLPELPASLSLIDVKNNNLFTFPGKLPPDLTWIDCRDNPNLIWLPELTHNITDIWLDTVPLQLDESESYMEITPEIITYINTEHERLCRQWVSDRLAVYKTELLERQLEITMNPDRIARLIQNGELGELGTWSESLGI